MGVIAYNVGNLLRRLVLPPAIPVHPEPIATDMIKVRGPSPKKSSGWMKPES